jgi:hypothetical protein
MMRRKKNQLSKRAKQSSQNLSLDAFDLFKENKGKP